MELPEFLQDATYETILASLLAQVPDDVDKSQGSFIYDALSPVAVELTEAAIGLRKCYVEDLLKLPLVHI